MLTAMSDECSLEYQSCGGYTPRAGLFRKAYYKKS